MSTGSDDVRYDVVGDIAVVTVNRPEQRNPWSVPVYREVVAAIGRANTADEVGAVVLTATGSVYSAGVDLKAPPEPAGANGRRPTVGSEAMTPDTGWLHVLRASKPVVAAVNGPAVGLGVTHLLAADVRIAARSATFSFPFLALGAMPELGASGLLSRLVGEGRALDLCLRARTIDAVEAERIGLVTEVVDDEALNETAVDIARGIAGFPRLQTGLTKALFHDNALEPEPNEVLRREGRAFVAMFRARGAARSFES